MASWMPGHTPTAAPAAKPASAGAPPANVRQVVMCMADDAMASSSPLKEFEKRAVNWRNTGVAGDSLRAAFRDAVDNWTMVQQRMTNGARIIAAPNRNATAVMASADEYVYGAPCADKFGVPTTLPDIAGQMVMSWIDGNDRSRALSLYNEHRRRQAKNARAHGREDDASVY
jgi:hypothetical protein